MTRGIAAPRNRCAGRLHCRGDRPPCRAYQLFAVAIILTAPVSSAGGGAPLLLADPTLPLQQAWTHQSFGAATRYESVTLDGVPAIRALGREFRFRPVS